MNSSFFLDISDDQSVTEQAQTTSKKSGEIPVDYLQGALVVDSLGQDVGDLDEVLVDLATGRITRVVLNCGSWFESLEVALPWEALRWDSVNGCLVYHGTVDSLQASARAATAA